MKSFMHKKGQAWHFLRISHCTAIVARSRPCDLLPSSSSSAVCHQEAGCASARLSPIGVAGFSSSSCSRPLSSAKNILRLALLHKETALHDARRALCSSPGAFCSSLLDEREFHKLADELLQYLQEKIDELGEECDIDGFDIDHAEGVLTIKLGELGTYVINKQTPNRQIWLSSPVSGPARFDWDVKNHCWVYRRTKSEILQLLEKEIQELLGASITLSK